MVPPDFSLDSTMIADRSLPGIDPLHLARPTAETRIVVAMSGGVDSSVVAALLHEAGHDVVGITLQLYDHGAATGRKGTCCAGRDIADARRVAAHLGIPHYVLDYEERFRQAVIDEFVDSYVAGETPVPCIRCNQQIKFGDLLRTARQLGASALATGQYVRSRLGPHGFQLHQPVDRSRDQSYFLFATTREELDFLRFPIGGMTKAEVREHARRLGLPVAEKADSQDICFVPSGHYSTLIDKLRPNAARAGEIVDLDGLVLGHHRGITHFTIGQRKGLGLAADEPLFVVALDPVRARVIVGPRSALEAHVLYLKDFNWLGERPIRDQNGEDIEVAARIRSTGPAQPARLSARGENVSVTFPGSVRGISPGQACVLYSDSSGAARMLGGGWIREARCTETAPNASLSTTGRKLAVPAH
jgi:tRNA-uridine 2-sulfurtransferase